MQIPKLLTPQEVSKILQLNLLTIYDYIHTQKLQAIKFGRKYRIDQDTLDEFIKARLTS